MRSQQTELVQKKKKREKNKQMKEEKMSTQLMVSDVDSSGERLPLKGLRKVTILYVFSLLLLLQMANIKKKK